MQFRRAATVGVSRSRPSRIERDDVLGEGAGLVAFGGSGGEDGEDDAHGALQQEMCCTAILGASAVWGTSELNRQDAKTPRFGAIRTRRRGERSRPRPGKTGGRLAFWGQDPVSRR